MSAITFLGLGAMGSALARAQSEAGAAITVWNRTAARAPSLGSSAKRTASVDAAIAASPLVVVCLLDDRSASDVLFPAAARLRDRTVVNLTSGTPEQARAKAQWASENGIRYLAGGIMAVPPMIGSPHATVLYSGQETVFDEHQAVLARFGTTAFVGVDVGRAALLDIALLVSMYGLFGAFAQAAVMVESGGMRASELAVYAVPWLSAMTGSLPTMADRIDRGSFGEDVGSNLAMQAVGMDTIVEACRAAGADPALMETVRRWIRGSVDAGFGGDDLGRIVDMVRTKGATPLSAFLASPTER